MNIHGFWQSVLHQEDVKIRGYFAEEAYVQWHNTNERFDVDEFIKVNCEYPGSWDGTIERMESMQNLIITVTHVFSVDKTLSFHVVSFISIKDDLIVSMDEYWGDDGDAPQWRLKQQIGRPIQ